ncbi:hypothetical protein HAX54_038243, partial [Datura stramonium]|nr:hypothetical protein [Datura stramonium]
GSTPLSRFFIDASPLHTSRRRYGLSVNVSRVIRIPPLPVDAQCKIGQVKVISIISGESLVQIRELPM